MDDPAHAQPLREDLFAAWDFYLLRAPLGATRPQLTGAETDAGAQAACSRLLRRAVQDEHLMEALALASPSLRGLLLRVAAGDGGAVLPAQLRRAAFAVLRYDLRMRTRPTPFGLFAGVACGDFESDVDAGRLPRTPARGSQRTRTQVDMQWLLGVVQELETRAVEMPALRVHAHPALVVRGDRVVLDCASTFGAVPGRNSRARVSVRHSAPVRRALELGTEPVRLGQLTERLVAEFGERARERVRGLLSSLIAEEVLLTELRPALDGSDPLTRLCEVLDAANAAPVAQRHLELRELADRIAAYDRIPAGSGAAALADTVADAQRIHQHPTPLHVDARLAGSTALPAAVAAEVAGAAELMWRTSTPKIGLHALRDYHAQFLERYGTDRLVPLLDLLDGNVGLGPPAGYSWPNSDVPDARTEAEPDRDRDRLLHRLLADALRSGDREVVVDASTMRALCRGAAEPAQVPNSCEVTVQVAAPSAERLLDGEFLVSLSPSPGSHHAGSTFMRFAGALDADHERRLHEESSALPTHVAGALRADLAFLPRSGKAANLAHTAPDTGHRIGVGVFDSPSAAEIRLGDIGVGATLERLCAVHLPTGRELTPVLANMVSAPAQAPNAARLLWEIGLEGQRLWEPWKWGRLADSPFVPRIRFGRFVLAPAVWRLDDVREAAAGRDPAEAVARWRARYDVPRHVLIVSNDQRLGLDLDDPWHVELLLEEVRKDPDLVVHEVAGEHEGWLHGELAGHIGEVVVPLRRRDPEPRRAATPAYREPRERAHGPGGEWLYLKLYGTARGQDDLLRNRFGALVDTARELGADRWFFLRYTDPDGHHLRLRLHGEPHRLWSDVVPELGRTLLDWQQEGLLRTHRIDQYDPEYERYGGIRLAPAVERLFQADSAAAIELLSLAADPECPYDLDTLAAISVAALAEAFGPPGTDPGAAAAEFWLGRTGTRRDLPKRYRRSPAYWAGLVDPAGGSTGLAAAVFGAKVLGHLRGRDELVTSVRAEMDRQRVDGDCRIGEGRFLGSLLHMHCNRLFGGDSEREREVIALARGAVQDNANRRRFTG
ncbi:MAG: lantibiotic dehydratase [Saccharopolyspora sp.]|uniref:lantibiotic dehydratase n=1 Tax=Saccharopolyspora sp. TaxID=33915 RepID=UPI0025EAA5B8|nr:lantibiotic dehydratase [Saccharopolyspora sp.]MBQ6640375.1 lantibiotic dehydratase [Saccharopolyspora sp.]